MKTKLFNLLATALLVFVVLMPAFSVMAQENKAKPATKTKTVTLHKIVMDKEKFNAKNQKGEEIFPGVEGFDGKKYIGRKLEDAVEGKEQKSTIKNFFGDSSKEISGAYFAWQKKDENGNWHYINHLGEQLRTSDDLKHMFGDLTEDEGVQFYTGYLPDGDYRIVEVKGKSTYIGKTINDKDTILADSKAVPVEITLPVVNKDGIVEKAHVYPKNTEDKPEIDKNFSNNNHLKAIKDDVTLDNGAYYGNSSVTKATVTASIGDKIPYEVKTKVNAGTEYGKLVWKDSMTNGLTFAKDLRISAVASSSLIDGPAIQITQKDYEIEKDDRGFTLYLTKQGLEKVTKITKPKNEDGQSLNKGEDVEFTLAYSATVNGNAIVDVPEKNDIRLEYGNKPYAEKEPQRIVPGGDKLTVTKTWDSGEYIADDVTVTYTLTDKNGTIKRAVTLRKDTAKQIYDLGGGIKFNVTSEFSGEFTGLEDNGWYLSERVAGYNAEMTGQLEQNNIKGHVKLNNKKDTENPTPLHPTSPEVVVGGRRFVKTDYKDVKDAKRLTGAVFYVKKDKKYLVARDDFEQSHAESLLKKTKDKLNEKVQEYNKLSPEAQKGTDGRKKQIEINKAQYEYNAAFRQASLKYKWVEEKEKESATQFISDGDGRFEVSGLAYGSYELEEKAAPVGYGKLSNNIKFEINKGSYKGKSEEMNYELVAEKVPDAHAIQIKNRKITIPQTGGIGTVIFTVAGLVIMASAGYVMIRRRNHDQA